MSARRITKRKALYSVICLLIIALLAAAYVLTDGFFGILDKFIEGDGDRGEFPVEGSMEAHFIDVGQADCILVMSSGKTMLIDTGDLDNDYTDKIINYLKNYGITTINYLILTHPDSDHIGGAPEIINEFTVENCIMPDFVKTTKIYEQTLDALDERDVNVIPATAVGEDSEFTVGEAKCKVLAPLNEYSDPNDASVVIRLDFGKRSILFTGDAEAESESDMVKEYSASDLKADVLKSGHHGSRTSSSEALLDLVRPSYAVISCGEGNSYGHPHEETVDKYEGRGYTVYRTDIHGTVVLKTDGETLTFETERAA